MRALALVVVALALVPAASAGGDFVDLAVSGDTAWFVGSFGIRSISAGSPPTTALPASAAAQLSVAVAGGAVWVASVANGFVDGRLTRLDPATGHGRVVLHVPQGSVLAVAGGGGGSVYALVGRASGNLVVQLTAGGRVARRWQVVDAGRLAADASGCWVSTDHRLLHIRPDGTVVTVLEAAQLGDVATGQGAVWLPQTDAITRVDERTGVIRTVRAPDLHLGGFQHDVAVGAAALWTLDAARPALQRRSRATGRIARTVRLPGIPDAVVATPGAVWVGIAVTHQVLRFDPATLRRTLAVTVS
ncbi:MAG TPA: hypothetical protein VHC67_12555 [Gaiellaceae bacterium]|nr:hypothetical protein [Gaiellaceae bacterium]